MKKRKISILILIALVLVLFTGCLERNKVSELKLGKYVMQNTKHNNWAWVLLNENNEFIFNRGNNLSYRPKGTYFVKDRILTLYVNEDESYTFSLEGGKLIFKSGKFAENLIKKESVFKFSNK